MKNTIVSVEWLNDNLSKKQLVVIDASPNSTVSGTVSAVSELCIPNSRILNIKENFTNKDSVFPNTVPSVAEFEKACKSLGINTNSEIVIYDNLGIYTSPRVWWLFKIMGHEKVSVLNGGLIEWVKKGYPTVKKSEVEKEYANGNFVSNFNEKYVIKYEEILDNIASNKFLLIDARSAGRFNGTAPEPRKYLQSGSIPNSVNIPFKELLEDGKFKNEQELKAIFQSKIKESQKLVFSCGSGMTACIVLLASEIAFKKSNYIYDGSWTEYAELQGLKKVE